MSFTVYPVISGNHTHTHTHTHAHTHTYNIYINNTTIFYFSLYFFSLVRFFHECHTALSLTPIRHWQFTLKVPLTFTRCCFHFLSSGGKKRKSPSVDSGEHKTPSLQAKMDVSRQRVSLALCWITTHCKVKHPLFSHCFLPQQHPTDTKTTVSQCLCAQSVHAWKGIHHIISKSLYPCSSVCVSEFEFECLSAKFTHKTWICLEVVRLFVTGSSRHHVLF